MYRFDSVVYKNSVYRILRMTKNVLVIVILYALSIENTYSQIPNAEVVKYETSISYKSGILYKSISCDIKINNRDGDRYTKILIPFSKLSKVSKLNARILDLNGKEIKKMNLSDISEHSNFQDFSFFEDNMVKEFTLSHNIYPYIMSYMYLVQEKQFLYIDSWTPVINEKIPTIDAVLKIELPTDYPILFKNKGTLASKTDTLKDLIRYCWHSKFTPIDLPEKFMPNLNEFIPSVEVVPKNFIYDQMGSFESWTTYGDWQYNLIEKLSDLSTSEKGKIDFMVRNVTNKQEQIKILYHYLQDETRYVNISIKTGGLKPFPAAFVTEKKYGDCKALTNYMKAMLSHIGITSYYSKIFAADAVKNIDKSFPSQQFNHVILCVPIEKDTIWLDCTSKGPFNYLGTFTQNRDAYIIKKNSSFFAKTPVFKFKDVLDVRKVEFTLESNSEVIANFENTYRSDDFFRLLYVDKYLNRNELNIVINDEFIEKGFDLNEYKIIRSPRDSISIQLKYNATSSKIYRNYGNDKIIHLLPFEIPEFTKPSSRKYPLQFDFPINKLDTLDYLIPKSLNVINKLENQHIKSNFGEYSIQFSYKNSRIQIIKSFMLYTGTYSLKEYSDFYEFILKVKNVERNTLITIN